MTEDEMVGWHHQFDGHEFEQAPGVGDGQGSLECYSPWGCKESDTAEQLNGIDWVGQKVDSGVVFFFSKKTTNPKELFGQPNKILFSS